MLFPFFVGLITVSSLARRILQKWESDPKDGEEERIQFQTELFESLHDKKKEEGSEIESEEVHASPESEKGLTKRRSYDSNSMQTRIKVSSYGRNKRMKVNRKGGSLKKSLNFGEDLLFGAIMSPSSFSMGSRSNTT